MKEKLILLKRDNPLVYEIHIGEIVQAKNLLLTVRDESFAKDIVEGYNFITKPPKPLSSLAEDLETCKKIAHSLGLCFEGVVIEDDLIKIKTGDVVKGHLCISSDGDMSFHDEYTECRRILNCFQIVKLLLSKGYDIK